MRRSISSHQAASTPSSASGSRLSSSNTASAARSPTLSFIAWAYSSVGDVGCSMASSSHTKCPAPLAGARQNPGLRSLRRVPLQQGFCALTQAFKEGFPINGCDLAARDVVVAAVKHAAHLADLLEILGQSVLDELIHRAPGFCGQCVQFGFYIKRKVYVHAFEGTRRKSRCQAHAGHVHVPI